MSITGIARLRPWERTQITWSVPGTTGRRGAALRHVTDFIRHAYLIIFEEIMKNRMNWSQFPRKTTRKGLVDPVSQCKHSSSILGDRPGRAAGVWAQRVAHA